MFLNELKKAKNSTKKKFQKGRGIGTGNGKTCGKGHKGQRSRSGHMKLGFEGGQNPLYRRIPKFGFFNRNKKKYAIVSLNVLNKYNDDTIINIDLLKKDGIVKPKFNSFKILNGNKFTKKIKVSANYISLSAKKKIEELGGTIEIS